MLIKKLTIAVMGAMLGASSAGVYADNRFDTQGSALGGDGSFGSGAVTVHHNFLDEERQALDERINELEITYRAEIERLQEELELTRDALSGDIESVDNKTNVAQVAADTAQDAADEALAHADDLFQQLSAIEQEVVETQLDAKRAQQAANAAQGTADSALAEARAAQASANAADALARAVRTEARAAQNTANTALNEARNAQSDATAADILARKGIQDALAAYLLADRAQGLADRANSRADAAYLLAQEAYAIGVPGGAYAYFHQTTCPVGWVHANGSNGTVDLRGQFIRTWDAGRGLDSGRSARSVQSDSTRFPLPIHGVYHGFSPHSTNPGFGGQATPLSFVVTDDAVGYAGGDTSDPFYGFIQRATSLEAHETRPGNVALLACKKS